MNNVLQLYNIMYNINICARIENILMIVLSYVTVMFNMEYRTEKLHIH